MTLARSCSGRLFAVGGQGCWRWRCRSSRVLDSFLRSGLVGRLALALLWSVSRHFGDEDCSEANRQRISGQPAGEAGRISIKCALTVGAASKKVDELFAFRHGGIARDVTPGKISRPLWCNCRRTCMLHGRHMPVVANAAAENSHLGYDSRRITLIMT